MDEHKEGTKVTNKKGMELGQEDTRRHKTVREGKKTREKQQKIQQGNERPFRHLDGEKNVW